MTLDEWMEALRAFREQYTDRHLVSVHPHMVGSAIDKGIPLFVHTLEQARDLRKQGCRLIFFTSDNPNRPPTVSEILARS